MELREVLRIVRKRWLIALVGAMLAIVAAYETYAHRAAAQYQSTSTVFVAQGRYPVVAASAPNGANLTGLALLYSQIAQSDLIRNAVHARPNAISAGVITSGPNGTGSALPFFTITATANSGTGAQVLAEAATTAVQQYVAGSQPGRTSPSNRISLQVVTPPAVGTALSTRTRVVLLPFVVLLTILLVTLGVIFLLENLSRTPQAGIESGQAAEGPGRSRWLEGAGGGGAAQASSIQSGLARQ
jgi:hypothetical protein